MNQHTVVTAPDPGPFVFHTELHLAEMAGASATTLQELRSGMASVAGSSIFFHTHHAYLSQHFQRPVYYNDFARWVADALREEALAEQIAALDMLSFTSIRDLREAMLHLIDRRLGSPSQPAPEPAPREERFYFCRSRSVILASGLVAHTVPGLFTAVGLASNASLYYHFFLARLRLGRPSSNFSDWLAKKGRPDLADLVDALNPYERTLDELKSAIVAVGRDA